MHDDAGSIWEDIMKLKRLPVLGWREWIALPDLGIKKLRCKVDTGATTSALHAFYVEEFSLKGIAMVRFGLHPIQGDTEKEVHCEAKIFDQRSVSDSGGHSEMRYVIQTPLVLGESIWPIEITLTNRDTMRYRMLLGRSAITDNFLVDSGNSHLAGKPAKSPVALTLIGHRHDEEE